MNSITFYPYQEEISEKACNILRTFSVVYLAMGMRTGKTLTSLLTAEKMGVKNVLFLTKKKVVEQVYNEYAKYPFSFKLFCTNYEQIKNISNVFELVIVDEAHNFGAFPKPSLRQRLLKKKINKDKSYLILLSGTPCPESISQIYHQFDMAYHRVFPFKNFYQFAQKYVEVYEMKRGVTTFKMYDKCKVDVLAYISHLFITYGQTEADIFVQKKFYIIELIPQLRNVNYMVKCISKWGYYEGDVNIYTKNISDEMQKCWQLSGGGYYVNDDDYYVLDNTKAQWIKEFSEPAVIFYKFKYELEILKETLGDMCSNNINDKGKKKFILLQIQSGREGVTLDSYDNIIYYNLDFSYTSWVQSQERCTAKNKNKINIYILQYKDNPFEKALIGVLKKKTDFNKKVYESYKKSL